MKFIPGKKAANGEIYAVISHCGQYSISRSRDSDGWRYSAWHRKQPIGDATRDRAEAERICRDHRDGVTTEREFALHGDER